MQMVGRGVSQLAAGWRLSGCLSDLRGLTSLLYAKPSTDNTFSHSTQESVCVF